MKTNLTSKNVETLTNEIGNRWTKRGDRLYLSQEFLFKAIGLEAETYKGGAVRYAKLNGEKISNSKASKIVDGIRRAYIDLENGELCDAAEFEEEIVEAVNAEIPAIEEVKEVEEVEPETAEEVEPETAEEVEPETTEKETVKAGQKFTHMDYTFTFSSFMGAKMVTIMKKGEKDHRKGICAIKVDGKWMYEGVEIVVIPEISSPEFREYYQKKEAERQEKREKAVKELREFRDALKTAAKNKGLRALMPEHTFREQGGLGIDGFDVHIYKGEEIVATKHIGYDFNQDVLNDLIDWINNL